MTAACSFYANLQKMEKSNFDKLKEHVTFLTDLLNERQLEEYIAWLEKRID